MNFLKRKSALRRLWLAVVLASGYAATAAAQTCLTADDMDASLQTTLAGTAKKYYDIAARGDTTTLKQNAIASLASNFSAIETALRDNHSVLADGTAAARPAFLLQAEGTATLQRAEFLCGVFGPQGQTAHSVVFVLPDLPPGDYGVAIFDVSTVQGPYTVSFVLQKDGTTWKMGGLFIKAAQSGGHDGNWFAERAREYKAKSQNHNAWLYFLQARDLLAPVSFMSTLATDKLYDEAQTIKPGDLPPLDLSADGKNYKLTALFPMVFDNEVDLVVKYEAADVSNTTQTFQNNVAVIKALVAKYPEFRDAFHGVVARAVEPSGRDYGTLLMMKDVK